MAFGPNERTDPSSNIPPVRVRAEPGEIRIVRPIDVCVVSISEVSHRSFEVVAEDGGEWLVVNDVLGREHTAVHHVANGLHRLWVDVGSRKRDLRPPGYFADAPTRRRDHEGIGRFDRSENRRPEVLGEMLLGLVDEGDRHLIALTSIVGKGE